MCTLQCHISAHASLSASDEEDKKGGGGGGGGDLEFISILRVCGGGELGGRGADQNKVSNQGI